MYARINLEKLQEADLKLKEVYALIYLIDRFEAFYFSSQDKTGRQAKTTMNCLLMSQGTMAEELKVSTRTMNRYIKTFIEKGLAFKLFHSMNGKNVQFAWVITHDDELIKKLKRNYEWNSEYKCWFTKEQPELDVPEPDVAEPIQIHPPAHIPSTDFDPRYEHDDGFDIF